MRSKTSRRRVIKSAGAASLIGLLAGCSSDGGAGGDGDDGNDGSGDGSDGASDGTDGGTTTANPSDPIKIGGTYGLTGTFGVLGPYYVEPMKIAVDEINENGGINGRELQLFVRDDETDPQKAIQNTRELISNKDIDAMYGVFSSSIGLALSEFLSQEGVPFINNASNTPQMTGEKCRRNTFRFSHNSQSMMEAMALSALEKFDGSGPRICGVNPDYVFGQEAWEIFKNTIQREDPDAKVVAETFPTFQAGDYQSEIQKTLNADPDIMCSTLFGGDMTSFIQQAQGFDYFGEEGPQSWLLAVTWISQILGKDMPTTKTYGQDNYHWRYPDTKANNQFGEKFRDRVGFYPVKLAGQCYDSVYGLKHAIEESSGATPEDIITGLEGLEFEGPIGKVRVRSEDHHVLWKNTIGGKVGEVDFVDYPTITPDSVITHDMADYERDPICEFERNPSDF